MKIQQGKNATATYLDHWPIKKGNDNKYNLLFLNGIYLVHFDKRHHLQYKINPVYWTNDEQQQPASAAQFLSLWQSQF